MSAAANRTSNVHERLLLLEEIQRAAKTCANAKEVVISMFQEARMGKAIEAESALLLVAARQDGRGDICRLRAQNATNATQPEHGAQGTAA